MSWLALGLFVTAIGAFISTIDKVIVEHYLRNGWTYPFFMSLFLGIYAALILVVRTTLGLFRPPSLLVVLIALLPGLLHFAGAMLYTRALLAADAATVSGVGQTTPLFNMLWGFLFFGDVLAPAQFSGVLVLVISSMLLAFEWRRGQTGRVRINGALGLVVVVALLRSIADLCVKLGLNALDSWDVFGLSRLAVLVPAAVVFARPRERALILNPIRERGVRFFFLLAAVEGAAVVNLWMYVVAFSLGPLALVSATLATGPIFVLIYSVLGNWFKPGLVPLREGGGSLWLKGSLCLGIVVGVFLLRQS